LVARSLVRAMSGIRLTAAPLFRSTKSLARFAVWLAEMWQLTSALAEIVPRIGFRGTKTPAWQSVFTAEFPWNR